MADEALFIDVHHFARRKWGQNVCGDSFVSKRFDNEGRLIAVLSDGLGSGVKASILSSMTARMMLRFAEAGSDLLRSCEVMMESLPVCRERRISYATFSVVDCDMEGWTRLVEEGNPNALVMRGGSAEDVAARVVTSRLFPDRHMRVTEVGMKAGDRLIVCSDGVTQSGIGTAGWPLGWREEGVREYVESRIGAEPEVTSRELARGVVEEAMGVEPGGRPQDDTSCFVLHFRRPRRLMVLTGPPYDADRDGECAAILDGFVGKKAICGGTTANLVAREWGVDIRVDLPKPGGRLPPCGEMAGVDLVTEGVLTLTEAARRLENGTAGGERGSGGSAGGFVSGFGRDRIFGGDPD